MTKVDSPDQRVEQLRGSVVVLVDHEEDVDYRNVHVDQGQRDRRKIRVQGVHDERIVFVLLRAMGAIGWVLGDGKVASNCAFFKFI